MRRRVRRARQSSAKRRLGIVSFLLILMFCFSFLALEERLRPVALHVAAQKCRETCVNIMQNAVLDTLAEGPELYDNLFCIRENERGEVCSASVDAYSVTHLQNTIEKIVGDSLTQSQQMRTSVSLGTLSGFQLLAGLGPGIPVRFSPVSYVESRLESYAESYGINQTLLKAELVVSARVCAILAGVQTYETVESRVCVAQLLVVGNIPQVYAPKPA